MSTVTVNRVELTYEQIGVGPRIVFTHGAWSDGRAWEAMSDRLADHGYGGRRVM